MTDLDVGIDVQAARACPYAVLNVTTSRIVETAWIAAVVPPGAISGAISGVIPDAMNWPVDER